MTIDFEQLRRDKDVMRRALPADDNEAWEAWDRISTVLYEEQCGELSRPRHVPGAKIPIPALKKFNVHVRLADQYEAVDEDDAFDMMMDALEHREGLEIMGHDIIEELT